MRLLRGIVKPSPFKRSVFFCISDIVLFVFSLFISFLFHFELSTNISYFDLVIEVALFFFIVKSCSTYGIQSLWYVLAIRGYQ